MNRLKLRKPNRVFLATVAGKNIGASTVFIKDYTGKPTRHVSTKELFSE